MDRLISSVMCHFFSIPIAAIQIIDVQNYPENTEFILAADAFNICELIAVMRNVGRNYSLPV